MTLLAIAALTATTPLHATHNTGLVLHDTGPGQRGLGVGVTAGIKIKLGPERVVKRSQRVTLGIAAGPVIVLPDAKSPNSLIRSEASLIGLEFKPGYSSSLNLSGRPILAKHTPLGAAERSEDDGQDAGDKVAWVAAVAGVVAVVVIGGVYFAARANSD